MSDIVVKHRGKRGEIGRPKLSVRRGITASQWHKIQEGWSFDWPDTKVIEYAGISKQKLVTAYYDDPELREKRDLIRKYPELYAKKNIANSIQSGDISTSKWYLERRTREFAAKGSMDIQVNQVLSEEQLAFRLAKFLGGEAAEALTEPWRQLIQPNDVIETETKAVDAGGVEDDEPNDPKLLLS